MVPPAHIRQRRVALLGRGVPVLPLPLGPEELAERIPGRQAHANAVWTQPLDRRGGEILPVTDALHFASLSPLGDSSWPGNKRCPPRNRRCPDAARRSPSRMPIS